jgi:hypothetical protein
VTGVAGQTPIGAPPRNDIFISWLEVKNPSHSPSGEKKGVWPPVVPGSGRDSKPARSWTKIWDLPSVPPTKARWRPSRDRARASRSPRSRGMGRAIVTLTTPPPGADVLVRETKIEVAAAAAMIAQIPQGAQRAQNPRARPVGTDADAMGSATTSSMSIRASPISRSRFRGSFLKQRRRRPMIRDGICGGSALQSGSSRRTAAI